VPFRHSAIQRKRGHATTPSGVMAWPLYV